MNSSTCSEDEMNKNAILNITAKDLFLLLAEGIANQHLVAIVVVVVAGRRLRARLLGLLLALL